MFTWVRRFRAIEVAKAASHWVVLATAWPEFLRIWQSNKRARNPDFLRYFESELEGAK